MRPKAKEESRTLSAAPTAKTEVTIMVMDVNDEAPRFRGASYVCEVSEGAQANSPLTFLGNAKPEVFDHDQVSAMNHLHAQPQNN